MLNFEIELRNYRSMLNNWGKPTQIRMSNYTPMFDPNSGLKYFEGTTYCNHGERARVFVFENDEVVLVLPTINKDAKATLYVSDYDTKTTILNFDMYGIISFKKEIEEVINRDTNNKVTKSNIRHIGNIFVKDNIAKPFLRSIKFNLNNPNDIKFVRLNTTDPCNSKFKVCIPDRELRKKRKVEYKELIKRLKLKYLIAPDCFNNLDFSYKEFNTLRHINPNNGNEFIKIIEDNLLLSFLVLINEHVINYYEYVSKNNVSNYYVSNLASDLNKKIKQVLAVTTDSDVDSLYVKMKE